jgi:hypothetical protein
VDAPPLSADRLVDESGRPFFEREESLERAFLAVRSAAAARAELDQGHIASGAPVVFPSIVYSVFEEGSGCGAAGQRPLTLDHEPGAVYPHGLTSVRWSTTVKNVRIEGTFTVAVGVPLPADSTTCTMVGPGGRRTELASPLPSIKAEEISGTHLARELRRLVDADRDAKARILILSEGLLRSISRRFAAHLKGVMDEDDAKQIASIKALQLAARFAGPDRPKAAWGRVLGLGAHRAVTRKINEARGVGRPELAVGKLLSEQPEMAHATVDEVRTALVPLIAEAQLWSDERIAEAMAGPPTSVSLEEELVAPDPTASPEAGFSTEELLRALLPDEAAMSAATPWLEAEGLIAHDGAEADSKAVARSRRAVLTELGRRLRLDPSQATSVRKLVESFAMPDESYDRAEDRRLMEERARAAVLDVVAGVSGGP